MNNFNVYLIISVLCIIGLVLKNLEMLFSCGLVLILLIIILLFDNRYQKKVNKK